MSRANRHPVPPPPIWQGVVTIGELEKLAGIEDRAAFWLPFAKIADSRESIDAGVRVLRKIAEDRHAKAST